MTSMLTPQVSEAALAAALDAFRSVLGPDAVHAGADELREFRDPFAYATWDDYTASAVSCRRPSRRFSRSCGSPTSARCRSGPMPPG